MQGGWAGWIDCTIQSMERWQTLIAGILAVIVAAWTVWEIRKQIKLQKKQIDDEENRFADARRSKAWVVKAHLPDALSTLSAYAAKCFNCVWRNVDPANDPKIPEAAIAKIKDAIEYADPITAEGLYKLVVHFQVHNSRLASREPNDLDPAHRAQLAYDAVLLRCLVDGWYGYARSRESVRVNSEPTLQTMMTALHMCVGFNQFLEHVERYASLTELIQLNHPEQG